MADRQGKTVTANELTASLLIEIPKRFPQCRVRRNNRVDAMAIGRGGRPRRVRAGIDGQGDICGTFPVYWVGRKFGVSLEIEVKVGRDKQRESQKNFEHMITEAGGIYIIARDVEGCLKELEEWA